MATREANIVPSESDSPSVKMRLLAWFSQAFKGPVVMASEAKQSSFYGNKESWIASSQVLLAMTFRHDPALSRRRARRRSYA